MDLEALLTLQLTDTTLSQLRHRLDHDPAHGALAEAVRDHESLTADLAAVRSERDAITAEQQRLERDSADVQARVDKDSAALYDGSVTAHKDLIALQQEVDHLRERISSLDDLVLEQMELGEPLDGRIVELTAALADADRAIEDRRADLTAAQAEISVELDAVRRRRDELAATIDPELVARYERIARAHNGQGVARLAPGGSCEGCHLTLPRAEYDELRRAPADEIHECPECGSILVRGS
ncbi:MAG: C4-type zinc ribbon domain-containing protein [Microthrixaceae bacterium]